MAATKNNNHKKSHYGFWHHQFFFLITDSTTTYHQNFPPSRNLEKSHVTLALHLSCTPGSSEVFGIPVFCWRNHIPKWMGYLQFTIATSELNVVHQVYSGFDLPILLMIKTIYFCLAHLEHLLVNFDCLYEEAGVNNNNCSKPQPSWIQHPWAGWTNMVIFLSTSPGKNNIYTEYCTPEFLSTCLHLSELIRWFPVLVFGSNPDLNVKLLEAALALLNQSSKACGDRTWYFPCAVSYQHNDVGGVSPSLSRS